MVMSRIDERRIRETVVEDYTPDSITSILEHRLIEGERRIAAAEARGENTDHLVDFWIDLLHQYERSVDALPRAA